MKKYLFVLSFICTVFLLACKEKLNQETIVGAWNILKISIPGEETLLFNPGEYTMTFEQDGQFYLSSFGVTGSQGTYTLNKEGTVIETTTDSTVQVFQVTAYTGDAMTLLQTGATSLELSRE